MNPFGFYVASKGYTPEPALPNRKKAVFANCDCCRIGRNRSFSGTPSGIRTLDPLIKSQLLYQLS